MFAEDFTMHSGVQDEADLKADFPSMGNTPEIPRVFKTASRVRNKNVTKRQTEMLVKEIWKARMTNRKAGKAGVDLPEMIFLHLQKTKGLHQAVIEVLHAHTNRQHNCTSACMHSNVCAAAYIHTYWYLQLHPSVYAATDRHSYTFVTSFATCRDQNFVSCTHTLAILG